MIDFANLPIYSKEEKYLQEFFMFSICVANKSAATIAPRIDKLVKSLDGMPFDILGKKKASTIQSMLKNLGIGCYKLKGQGIKEAACAVSNGDLSLQNSTLEELEKINGVGLKTSRFFVVHSRPNAHHAVIDTHLLKFLKSKGHDVPEQTPTSK